MMNRALNEGTGKGQDLQSESGDDLGQTRSQDPLSSTPQLLETKNQAGFGAPCEIARAATIFCSLQLLRPP